MLRSYFIIAIRQLTKSRIFSAINVLGLAVALTAFMFIMQYAAFESSFDKHYTNADRIYRVALRQTDIGTVKQESAHSYPGIYDFAIEHLPEVEVATRFAKIPANTGFLFGYQDKIYNETGGFINADSNFFKVFPELLLRGDPKTVLKTPHGIVIAESIARKVFGNVDPIGQQFDSVSERGSEAPVITGVMKDMPANSHFHAKFVARIEDNWREVVDAKWLPSTVFNYLLLKNGASPNVVSSEINDMLESIAANVPDVKGAAVHLQPLTSIHLESHFSDEFEANGSIMLIYLLLGVGVVIMSMSWINYINIETARFLRRAREVGVRRVIGSGKSDLVLQFLVEFLCINCFATAVAGSLIYMFSGVFTDVTGVPFDLVSLLHWDKMWLALLFLLVGTVATGIGPCVYIIRLKPALALKGSFNPANGRGLLRRPLLVIQFSASMFLFASLLVINAQLDYMRVSNRKVDVDRVIAIKNPIAYAAQEVVDKYNNYSRLRNALDQLPAVERVETSSAIPGTEIGFTYVNLIKRTTNDAFDPTRYKVMFVGENFLPLYGINLLAGRNFEIEGGGSWKEPWERDDWYKIIINEKASRILGFKSPQEAVNQVVKFQVFDEFQDHEIIGVVEDYHHEALNRETHPMILKSNFNSYQQVYYSIRFQTGANPHQAISDIETSWRGIFPEHPFEYFFLDDYYDQQFKNERKISAVFSFFAAIAVFIGCLGVLGMALFESRARIKEVSIRKVLGASLASLLGLLSREQMKCLVISSALVLPVIWYAAESWLSTYPYRVDISVIVLFVPVLIVIGAVSLVSSLQALKAVNVNPVEHLKNE
ncbi:ABC transporter permease [Chryseolinea sp. T2]|uniref:ABC transporter permease n=1 Tax=Chryseolinea sp. T2 TaxID=3129255 RepID=UPI003076D0B3